MLLNFAPVEGSEALYEFLVFDCHAVILERNIFDYFIFLIELIGKFFYSHVQNFYCYLIAKSLLHFIVSYILLGFVDPCVSLALKRTLRLFLRNRTFFGLIAQLFERKIALGFRALLIIATTDKILGIFLNNTLIFFVRSTQ